VQSTASSGIVQEMMQRVVELNVCRADIVHESPFIGGNIRPYSWAEIYLADKMFSKIFDSFFD